MDWQVIIDTLPAFLDGALITIQLTVISITIGFLLAVPLAILRMSKNPLLWAPVYGFVFLFRGTPLVVQIFLIYYGSGQFREFFESVGLWTFFRDAWFCAILSLTLNTAAYSTEIIRGGIKGVPHGEVEAAKACGMSGVLLFRRIILPKAMRIAFPAYTNEIIFLLQATSLVSLVTILDITGVATRVAARSFDTYEMYLSAAAIYLVLVYGLQFLFKKVEFSISGHLRQRPGDSAKGKAKDEALAQPAGLR